MRQKTVISLAIALVVVVLGAVIIRRALRPADARDIRIGVILPLTGDDAQRGVPLRNAALLAVEEINGKGGIKGKKLELEIEDDKCEVTAGMSAAQKIASGQSIAIVGSICSPVTLAVASIAESTQVVLVSPAQRNQRIITGRGDYIFSLIPTDVLRGRGFAEYIYSAGYKKVSLLYINNSGGVGKQTVFSENFDALGGTVVSIDAYPPDTRDVRAALTEVKQRGPDALVVVSGPDDTAVVMRQARELKVRAPLFFQSEALDDPAVIEMAGNAANGATYIGSAEPDGPQVDAFTAEYRQRYGEDPESFAADAYDAVMLIGSVLEVAADISSDDLKAGLYKIQNYEGASGIISFDQEGNVIKPMAIKRIQGGQATVVATKQ